jgi:dolichol kinase/phosphoserine phosphatase
LLRNPLSCIILLHGIYSKDRDLNTGKKTVKRKYRGLIVFDVDGVLFRTIFLNRVARTAGSRKYLRTLFLGWRYYTNGISFSVLLEAGLNLLQNLEVEKALKIANSVRRTGNILHAMKILHERGYFISLMSSGIPNFVLEKLMQDIGADHYAGLNVKIRDGRISIDQITVQAKEEIVEDLLGKLDLTWNDVISIVDDPNNLRLMQMSRLGIGFNPSRIIRRHADVVVDGYDMLEVIPHVISERHLPERISLRKQLFRRELYRKAIHFLGVPLPFLAYFHRWTVIVLLSAVIVIYGLSEIFRAIGFHFPFFSHITKRSERITETRGFIIGPISLTIGILIPLFIFDADIFIPAILIVCISDSLSGLVGRRFGRIVLPFYHRTVEGCAAFFLSSLAILIFFIPLPLAALTAAVSTIIELLMPHYLDNLLIPLGTAAFMYGMLPRLL